ncbi:MAG: sigma-70 family RNA polymerase sigma factor [Phycisphaeraceae bacterium]|nr:sigma-70 family RNA polymerase sigma factor [Phycisphaeraceae bacterium]
MDLNSDQGLGRLTDEELVERYRSGQDGVFEELVVRYQETLFHFLMRFVGRRAVAEDLFQEAFLQVHLSIDTFDTSRRFRPWLFTIAANKARDWLRRNNQINAHVLSAPLEAGNDDGRQVIDLLESPVPLPDLTAEREETRRLVQDTVQALPDHLKEVLLLAYFQRLAYKDIAQMLGVPLGTVKSRLHAAVAAFAEQWRAAQGEWADQL